MPRPDPRRGGAALAAVLGLIGATLPGPDAAALAAEPTPAQLEEVERALEQESGRAQSLETEAQALAKDVARLQQELIAAARTAQDSEEEMSQLEGTLAVLEEEAAAAEAELTARRGQLAAILGALQRLALQPPEAMLLGPATPLDTVRGATLLKVALPGVEGRARALKTELESLRQLRSEIDSRRQQLAGATTRLEEERRRLAALVEEKQALRQQTESERLALDARVAALGQQAADLKELMARISLAPPPVPGIKPAVPGAPDSAAPDSAVPDSAMPESAAPPAAEPAALLRLDRPAEIREFPETEASLTTPARGTVVIRYGEAGPTDQSSKGITIATRSQAQVVAPFDGQVMFRGPFRGYGEILILEHAGGYHTLLAGLGRTDAIVGQWLLAGEPVGAMGPAAGGNPELYLELRRDGQPINPLPWLDIRDSKTE